MPFFNSLSGGQRKLLLPGKTFVLLQSRKEKKSTSLKCISWSYINDIPIVARTNAILLAFSSISTYLQEFQSFLNIQFHIYNQNSILKSLWCCVVVRGKMKLVFFMMALLPTCLSNECMEAVQETCQEIIIENNELSQKIFEVRDNPDHINRTKTHFFFRSNFCPKIQLWTKLYFYFDLNFFSPKLEDIL